MLREMHLSKTNSGQALFQHESSEWKCSLAILFCYLEVSPYLQDVQAGSGMFPICCSLTPPFPVSICAQYCSVHQCSSMGLVQSQPVLGKCSLKPDSQRAFTEDTTASQKTVHCLQNLLFCTYLPSLMCQVGSRDPTQPSGLTSMHLLHCYREGTQAFPSHQLTLP